MHDPIDQIRAEVKDGLPNEDDRLTRQRKAQDFYRGNFDAHDPRDYDPALEDCPEDLIRTVPIMQAVVKALARHLYARGPARTLPGSAAASKWLSDLYAAESADSLLQEADRQTFVAEVAAIEAHATDDPTRPVGLRLWPAHQLIVWEDPDDATRPIAVGTLDYFDRQRRLRVWTAETYLTFVTAKEGPGQTSGGTAWTELDAEENTYGVIPFAFVHCNQPTCEFWSGSPGPSLVRMNEYINYRLTVIGDNLRFSGNPVMVITGIGESWRPPGKLSPGTILYPTPGDDAAGNGTVPTVESFQHETGYVEAGWTDLQSYADLELECDGVPPAAIRLVQGESPSGVAIVAEQLPLIQAAQARQRPFGGYERDLARVALAVGRVVEARDDLDPALARGLSLRWPSMVPEVPMTGKDQDDADDWALAHGAVSLIQVVMRRFSLSREEAIAHLEQVALDRAAEEAMRPPTPAKVKPAATNDPQPPTNRESDDDAEAEAD